jgi:penicillin-binding protein 2
MEGLINEKSTVQCAGSMQFGSRRISCWKRHGPVDFLRSIKESCDVFYYQLGAQLGIDRIAKYARLFGFGVPTKVRLAGEQSGLIPDSEWKLKRYGIPWQPGETLSVAIGQGYVDVTPLQLVTAYAALSNGGFVYRPFLVRRVEKKGGEILKEYQPELQRKIEVSNEYFDLVKKGLFEVVNAPGGTAGKAKSTKTIISGKTGTAQVRSFSNIMKVKCDQIDLMDRHHGIFVGYAPPENPEIAVVAIAEHACHSWSAAPIVKDVIETYFDKYHGTSQVPIATLDTSPEPEQKRKIARKGKDTKEDGPEEDSVSLGDIGGVPLPKGATKTEGRE